MTGWAAGPLLAFDTETTGLDVDKERIVSAYLGNGGEGERSWLLDPGLPIPPEATAIHGITSEEARENGRPAGEGVAEIVEALATAMAAGAAVVTYNARFDFTLLDRECRRHGVRSLEARLGGPVGPIVDPLILDRHVDRYRPGRRTLVDASRVYQVELGVAHNARSDALAALGVARALAVRYPDLAALTATSVHELQVRAALSQAADFAAYLRRQGLVPRDDDGAWPLRSAP